MIKENLKLADFLEEFYAYYWENEVETPNEDMEFMIGHQLTKRQVNKWAEEGHGYRKEWKEFPETIKKVLREHIEYLIFRDKVSEFQVDHMVNK